MRWGLGDIVKKGRKNYTYVTKSKDRKGKDMFSIFEQEKVTAYGMIISFVLSLGVRMFLGMLYSRMILETDNMATTGNRLLKQCKLKFTHCYQLNNGVANVPVFVEKFLTRLSWGPVSFGALYHISGQLMMLSVIFAGVGACRAIVAGHMFGEILPFYLCTLCNVYLYFSVAAIVDVKQKRKNLKINLIDYLENHLSNRMEVTREDICMLYGEGERVAGGKIIKGLELMPIAGWLADRNGREVDVKAEIPDFVQQEHLREIRPAVGLEEGEAEALEELLKEFLSLS